MTENQYRELFAELGIEVRKLGNVLRYRGFPRRVYFNRNRNLGIYFSAHTDDEARYPGDLWDKIDQYLLKKADRERLNIVPKPLMEGRAFQNLVLSWQ